MLFSVIGISILIYALHDYKKAFLTFLVFKIFLDPNVSLILPAVPRFIALDYLMTVFFCLMLVILKPRLKLDKSPFPFALPFILLSISWFLSAIFSLVGFQNAFMQYVYNVLNNIVIIWIMWHIVSDKKDILFLLKYITVVFFIITLYAYFEKVTTANPIHEYKLSLAKNEAIDLSYDSLSNRGYRVQSVFFHAIGAGFNWCLYIFMTLIMFVQYNWRKNRLAILTAILCVPCVFFANSRSCLLFLLIGCLSFVNFKNKRFVRLFLILSIIAIVAAPYLIEYSNLLSSLFNLFDSDLQQQMGGSNVEMRQNQLVAVLGIWGQSPIWGHGVGFQDKMGGVLVEAALGFESIWFGTLARYGLIGVISNVVLMYYSVVKIPLKYQSKPIFFLSLAFWIGSSVTTIPALLTYYYYLIIFIIIKLQILSSKSTLNKTIN